MSNLKEDILEEYGKHGSAFRTARKLGIENIEIVLSTVRENKREPAPIDTSTCRHDGYGRPDIEEFFMGRCLATESWNNDDPEVAEARKRYELGTHDMATGRDGPWLILYSVPRVRILPRPNYFTPALEA